MKIAIDARIIQSSTGRYVERLLTHLSKIDTENKYYVLLKKDDMNYWSTNNSNFLKIEADYIEQRPEEHAGLKKILDRIRPDLVHYTMPHHSITYQGKFVVTIHDMTLFKHKNIPQKSGMYSLRYNVKLPIYKYLVRRSAKKSAAIIIPTESTGKELNKFVPGLPQSKIRKIFDAGEDLFDGTAKQYPGLTKREFFLYVGRAWPYKNLKIIIEAAKRLPQQNFVFVGKIDQFYQESIDYANSLNLKNVVFTDFAPDSQLKWLYKNAKALIFPSLSEGFGLPGLEAMNYSLPVLASEISCLKEVYGDAAKYFDPNDTSSLAKLIQDFNSNKGMQQKLIMNGNKKVAEYSWENTARQTLDVYKSVI